MERRNPEDVSSNHAASRRSHETVEHKREPYSIFEIAINLNPVYVSA